MADGFVIDVDMSDDFLDKPELVYREDDGSLTPLFTEEQEKNLGKNFAKPLKIPSSRVEISGTGRTFQMRLDGIGAALYKGVDAEAALRDFFADCYRGTTARLKLTERTESYARAEVGDEVLEAVLRRERSAPATGREGT